MTESEVIALYRAYSGPLYGTALRIVRDESEAEEIMHDTLLKFIGRRVRTSSEQQTSAWLRKTLIRMSIDRLRRRRRSPLELAEDISGTDFAESIPELEAEGQYSMDEILSALGKVPEPYALILNLVLLEELDYKEIAKLTGRKEPTLRSLFSRGRVLLAKQLKRYE